MSTLADALLPPGFGAVVARTLLGADWAMSGLEARQDRRRRTGHAPESPARSDSSGDGEYVPALGDGSSADCGSDGSEGGGRR